MEAGRTASYPRCSNSRSQLLSVTPDKVCSAPLQKRLHCLRNLKASLPTDFRSALREIVMSSAVKTMVALSCLALSGCDPAGGNRVDYNLECAALISAADVLVRNGTVEKDLVLAKRGLGSSMAHLNAYAIPKRIKEAEAFKQLKSHRETLISSRPAAEIVDRAKGCASRSPS